MKNKKENKTRKCTIRMTQTEFEGLVADMRAKGIKDTSKYVRTLINHPRMTVSQSDLDEINLKLIYEINKIGNNINQIARYLNTYCTGNPEETVLAKQKEIEKIMYEILKLLK